MKRCPQCEFIYLDTDTVCDLDGSKLVQVSEADLVLVPRSRLPRMRIARVVAALAAITAGLAVFAIYYANRGREVKPSVAQPAAETAGPVIVASPVVTPAPSVEPTPSPESRPKLGEAGQKPAAGSAGSLSRNPVSTTALKERGSAVILLTNGARIEADEVWRTRQGVWYRRQGMVTLIKANRVRSIQRR
jgi:hypothetical protein